MTIIHQPSQPFTLVICLISISIFFFQSFPYHILFQTTLSPILILGKMITLVESHKSSILSKHHQWYHVSNLTCLWNISRYQITENVKHHLLLNRHCSLNEQGQVYNGRHCRPVLIRPNLSGYFPPKLKNVSLTRLIRSSQTTFDRRKFWKQNQDFLTK